MMEVFTIIGIVMLVLQFGFFVAIMIGLNKMRMIKEAFDDIIINFMTRGQDLVKIQEAQLKNSATNNDTVLKQLKEMHVFKNSLNSLQEISKSLMDMTNIMKKTMEQNKTKQIDINKLSMNIKTLSDQVKLINQKRR